MNKPISQADKYDQYLERLIEDAQRLDADFRNYIKLWSLLDEYLDEINEAPGTFRSILNAFKTSTVVLTHRLFDTKSIGLQELIRIADTHGAAIDWKGGRLTSHDLQIQRGQITAYQDTLDRLRKQRNKGYAHLDKKQILDREAFAQAVPLAENDMRGAIDLAHVILQKHYGARFNTHLEMGIVNAVNVKHLLELVRIGRKYWKEEQLS